MHTVDEAKKLWCPMVRCENGNNAEGIVSNSYAADRNPDYARCIADECAMWRWLTRYGCHADIFDDEEPDECVLDIGDHGGCRYTNGTLLANTVVDKNDCPEWKKIIKKKYGYCGLAGKPNE